MYIRLSRRESRKEGRKERIEGGRKEEKRREERMGSGGRISGKEKKVVKVLQIIMRCDNSVKTLSGTKRNS